MKKTSYASSCMLLVLLVGMFQLSLTTANFFPEKPPHAIYIRGNGNIEPETAPIRRVGDSYTFTADIINQPIVVERDNIAINGASFTLRGNRSNAGIEMSYRENVTISNIHIESFAHGIFSYNSYKNTIMGNNITGNDVSGISLLGASNCVISGNIVEDNGDGIKCVGTTFGDPCHVVDNIVRHNSGVGILTYTDNILSGNIVEDNNVNFSLLEPESTLPPELTPTASPEPTPSLEPTQKPEPFPTTLIIGSAVAVVAVVCLGLLVYLKKRHKDKSP